MHHGGSTNKQDFENNMFNLVNPIFWFYTYNVNQAFLHEVRIHIVTWCLVTRFNMYNYCSLGHIKFTVMNDLPLR